MNECDMDIRFCHGLQCQNTVGTYTCGCHQGFYLDASGSKPTCADVDECSYRNACPENAVCQNWKGGYKCTCHSGFKGEKCADVDECSINNATCDANADCYNTPGSYECACQAGFFGTGQQCEKGQCQDSICADNKKCKSSTTFECVCRDGFSSGVNDTCVDIDECSLGMNCDDKANCINSVGSYVCECQLGFHGNGTSCLQGDCIESDCPANEQCVSPRRSDCECKDGFHRDESGKCIDKNECETENGCDQNATCSNTEGSYYCECTTGFYGTGFSCLEGNCTDAICPGNQTCSAPTSSCDCSLGLKKAEKYCIDIDECSLGIHDCPARSNCINKVESYDCHCFAGYSDTNCTNLDVMVCQVIDREFECACKNGYDEQVNGTCTDINECSLGIHECQKDLECVNKLGDYACQPFCESGFERSDNGTCLDIDECASNIHNCSTTETCINTDGGFSCEE